MEAMIGSTRLEITEGDIADQDTDAVVTAAHWDLQGGQGTDGSIHARAGVRLLEECRQIGGCPIGDAVITHGYDLPARFVIHAVGPVFETGEDYEADLLAAAYRNSLQRAVEQQLRSISFPSISTGAFGYPMRLAAPIALRAIVEFLQREVHQLELVRLVLYPQEAAASYQIHADALEQVLQAGSPATPRNEAPAGRSYQALFEAAVALIDGQVSLDGRPLPSPTPQERQGLEEALQLLEQALDLEPTAAGAALFAAKAQERLGDLAQTVRWLRQAHQVAPGHLPIALELGAALSRQGLQAEAVGILAPVAQRHPEDARVHCNLGLSLLMSGDAQAAVAAFTRLAELEPGEQMNRRLLDLAVDVEEGRAPGPTSEAELVQALG
jgi:O-acetyl-ADP-ribose deacetylase (regulator of RNase III)